jgi:hypothetical protein
MGAGWLIILSHYVKSLKLEDGRQSAKNRDVSNHQKLISYFLMNEPSSYII